MAIRRHVTALRDCLPSDARTTFVDILGEAFNAVLIHENAGWTWFMTSVWGVAGSDLNKGLCRIARPALQFTTSDGCRWFVTIHGGPQGAESYLHDFGLMSRPADPARDEEMAESARQDESPAVDPNLEFLEDQVDKPVGPRTPFDRVAEDFAENGTPLPESLCATLRPLAYSDAVNRLRDWHAEAIIQSMQRAGLPLSADAVRAVLLWENVTDREQDGDLGNLPRLLSVLGLGGEWDDYVSQAEQPLPVEEPTPCDAESPTEVSRSADCAQDVLASVASLALVPLDGPAVAVSPKKLGQLGFAAEACSTGASPVVAVLLKLPPGFDRSKLDLPTSPCDEAQVALTDEGLRVGLRNRHLYDKPDLEAALGKSCARLLLKPPDGAVIEASFAVDGEPPTFQRFRGVVRDGSWWIDHSVPALSSEAVASVLVAASREWESEIKCRDVAEAMALEKAARRDANLWNNRLTRDGKSVSVEFDTGHLAKLFLRTRHPDSWDFGLAAAQAEQEFVESLAQRRKFQRGVAEAARQRAAPHDDEVLWKGKHSWFWRADFQRLEPLDQEPRRAFDATLEGLGFTLVGDLVARKQRDIAVRIFVSADRATYGVIMGKRTMYLGQEFVSRLSDGSGLTTTTSSMASSDPEAGIYFRNFAGLELEPLYRKHLEGLDRFRSRKGLAPAPLDDTLAGVAREIDLAFERQAKSEAAQAIEDEEEDEDLIEDEDGAEAE